MSRSAAWISALIGGTFRSRLSCLIASIAAVASSVGLACGEPTSSANARRAYFSARVRVAGNAPVGGDQYDPAADGRVHGRQHRLDQPEVAGQVHVDLAPADRWVLVRR